MSYCSLGASFCLVVCPIYCNKSAAMYYQAKGSQVEILVDIWKGQASWAESCSVCKRLITHLSTYQNRLCDSQMKDINGRLYHFIRVFLITALADTTAVLPKRFLCFTTLTCLDINQLYK